MHVCDCMFCVCLFVCVCMYVCVCVFVCESNFFLRSTVLGKKLLGWNSFMVTRISRICGSFNLVDVSRVVIF